MKGYCCSMDKGVYWFGANGTEGSADMKVLLGGKGANLAEMANLGLPVPPGFTITTEVCNDFLAANLRRSAGLEAEVQSAIQKIEAEIDGGFGDSENPLLLSVRSGARASMPGMMDTILNIGLNDDTVLGLGTKAGDLRFAYDSYRRLIQMYSNVVLGVSHHYFEEILEVVKEERGIKLDTELGTDDWRKVIANYRDMVERECGQPFPTDVRDQLWGAIESVFRSWTNQRAITYRRIHGIPDNWGTAVNVQAMVFGNMGDDSATGVAFTRNPSTGQSEFYGEYLVNAQGEDVVAGIRTPQHLTKSARLENGEKTLSMEERMPSVFAELTKVYKILEAHYREMQDLEFTVQKGELWMLQTRTGKRTATAALKIAVDMVEEGLIVRDEALSRVDPARLEQLLHPTLDEGAHRTVLARGLPASPGAASGLVVFSADEAEALAAKGEEVILVRVETSPEDIHGMHAAQGILTSRGGMTSHAAVVARGMGRPCVAGVGAIRVDYADNAIYVDERVVNKGDVITIDGSSGEVILGRVPTQKPELSGDFETLMKWADEVRTLGIRTNAETPTDVQTALEFGAEGIGLCRTEHMFFDSDRISAVREMILADDENGRRQALDKLLPMQQEDFAQLFRIMKGKPITIRLLDPPLHEFIPHGDNEIDEIASASGVDATVLRHRARELEESNPMLGHRGCRLAISFPEICEMQVRAIFEAALQVKSEFGESSGLEIMVPLIATRTEFDLLKERIDSVADEVEKEKGSRVSYMVGTMIELPRACLQAAEIAETAEFFSFGTNDLTQTAFGISRDDSGRYLDHYMRKGIFPVDPFVSIDIAGVGALMQIAAKNGRECRPDIKLGICGEHGGDPDSVRFCHRIGLDYVSCSPYRVPIARLAAAQAALEQKKTDWVA